MSTEQLTALQSSISMEWISDSTLPEVKTGMAIWTYPGQGTSSGKRLKRALALPNFQTAHDLNTLIGLSYALGFREGEKKIVRALNRIIEEYEE